MAQATEDQRDDKNRKTNYNNPLRQSSVVPYRIEKCGLEILMITSIRRRRWIIPKGIVEPDMTPQESAAKEALEEAGLEGTVYPERLGRYHYKKWTGVCRCDVYAMSVEKVHKTWDEQDDRDREWVEAGEAARRLRHKQLRAIVKKFIEQRPDLS